MSIACKRLSNQFILDIWEHLHIYKILPHKKNLNETTIKQNNKNDKKNPINKNS